MNNNNKKYWKISYKKNSWEKDKWIRFYCWCDFNQIIKNLKDIANSDNYTDFTIREITKEFYEKNKINNLDYFNKK